MRRNAPIFVDTAYFVALLNRRDRHHDAALDLAAAWHRLGTRLVTTDAVLVESFNWFARTPLRVPGGRALAALHDAPGWTIAHASPELIERGRRRYLAHGDKTWSLTDCISMEAASAHRVAKVATTDAHFTQAGFEILLA